MSDPIAREWTFRLLHMRNAILEINTYMKHPTLDDFSNDRAIVRAVERCFEILGEAARSVPKAEQNKFPNIPWSYIISFRNFLAHDYDEISVKVIWQTIRDDLPGLKQQLDLAIKEIGIQGEM